MKGILLIPAAVAVILVLLYLVTRRDDEGDGRGILGVLIDLLRWWQALEGRAVSSKMGVSDTRAACRFADFATRIGPDLSPARTRTPRRMASQAV
jgi:hypothetical protein